MPITGTHAIPEDLIWKILNAINIVTGGKRLDIPDWNRPHMSPETRESLMQQRRVNDIYLKQKLQGKQESDDPLEREVEKRWKKFLGSMYKRSAENTMPMLIPDLRHWPYIKTVPDSILNDRQRGELEKNSPEKDM